MMDWVSVSLSLGIWIRLSLGKGHDEVVFIFRRPKVSGPLNLVLREFVALGSGGLDHFLDLEAGGATLQA